MTMTFLVYPDAQAMRVAKLEAISHCPVLFKDDGREEEEVNWYIRDRAQGRFVRDRLLTPLDQLVSGNKALTPKSVESVARAIENFLHWCEAHDCDWRGVRNAMALLSQYEADLASGAWSARGEPLAANTILMRVPEARGFLLWTVLRGMREESVDHPEAGGPSLLDLTTVTLSHRLPGKGSESRPKPGRYRMPTPADVERWLEGVHARFGPSKALLCELVIRTGVRSQEALQWRTDYLSIDPEKWDVIGSNVMVEIRYGAKGPKWRDQFGDLYGPSRVICVPRDLAEKLHEYRLDGRAKARERGMRLRGESESPDPRRLFLSDFTGQPFGPRTFRQAWCEGPMQPFAGWSIHLGRHYWACWTILQCANRRAQAAALLRDRVPTDWLTANGMADIDLVVKPQLGHVYPETTRGYLVWLQHAFPLADFQSQYVGHLQGVHHE
jgi:hypothetical protein